MGLLQTAESQSGWRRSGEVHGKCRHGWLSEGLGCAGELSGPDLGRGTGVGTEARCRTVESSEPGMWVVGWRGWGGVSPAQVSEDGVIAGFRRERELGIEPIWQWIRGVGEEEGRL